MIEHPLSVLDTELSQDAWLEKVVEYFNISSPTQYRVSPKDRDRGRSYTLTDRSAALMASVRPYRNVHIRGSVFDLKNKQRMNEICVAILHNQWQADILRFVALDTPKGLIPLARIATGEGPSNSELSCDEVFTYLVTARSLVENYHRLMFLKGALPYPTTKERLTAIPSVGKLCDFLDGKIWWTPGRPGYLLQGYAYNPEHNVVNIISVEESDSYQDTLTVLPDFLSQRSLCVFRNQMMRGDNTRSSEERTRYVDRVNALASKYQVDLDSRFGATVTYSSTHRTD